MTLMVILMGTMTINHGFPWGSLTLTDQTARFVEFFCMVPSSKELLRDNLYEFSKYNRQVSARDGFR